MKLAEGVGSFLRAVDRANDNDIEAQVHKEDVSQPQRDRSVGEY